MADAVTQPDAGDPAGLRLWWEYLECVDWNIDFYKYLVHSQGKSSAYE